MNYLIFKSLHIISVVTWFAGLFYMPRLFVYFAEAAQKSPNEAFILQNQFKIMQRRLWFGITIPSSVIVFIFGGMLVSNFLPLSNHPWLIVKLIFVAGLYVYQNFLHQIYKQQQLEIIKYSPLSLRVINEVSTIFLVAIVFLVVLKSVVNMFYGLVGLVLFIFVLLAGIKIYKNIREKNDNKK
ncbi:MAG: protoporphyrinogen IX oxidase [Bacteriovoracaceae bacterium]|nr:protoporphyrinogen IX oxidase [Bacteriovoracaceae bacterium]